MEINRNNYEEYFLLYADNELTATEKKVVEIFVQENTDLKEEFLMIQMTVNKPDKELKLFDKSILLKEEPPFIDEKNYEKIFVLYHDGELSYSEKATVEKFVLENSKYKPEFELIGKSRIVSDESIFYPGKKHLYRKEKPGKLVPLFVWKAMAAAVFIGFGLWITVSYLNHNTGENIPVASEIKNMSPQVPKVKNTIPEKQPADEKTIASSLTTVQKNHKSDVSTGNKKQPVEEKKENNIAVANQVQKVNSISTDVKDNTVKSQDGQPMIAVNEPVKLNPNPMKLDPNIANIQANASNNQTAQAIHKIEPQTPAQIAQTVSYIPDVSSNDQNYVFYDVTTREFRKTKVGGFLKKVRRIVERSNPIARIFNGDEEQIAAK